MSEQPQKQDPTPEELQQKQPEEQSQQEQQQDEAKPGGQNPGGGLFDNTGVDTSQDDVRPGDAQNPQY